jgi:hypothetical protein
VRVIRQEFAHPFPEQENPMNNITALEQEIFNGGRINNGRITQRVCVKAGNGGSWYELSMGNDNPRQREITVRREDCHTPHTITPSNASRWLEHLRDYKAAPCVVVELERQAMTVIVSRQTVIQFEVQSVVQFEVGA